LFASLAAVIFCLAIPAEGQTFDATNLRQPTDLAAIWLVHAGDDPAYARPEFDDSHWTRFDSSTTIKPLFPNAATRPEIIWYRLHVKVVPGQTGLAMVESQISSAFEIYLNGQRLMKVGNVAPFTAHTFGAYLLEPIPDRPLSTGSFVIALRVHVSRWDWDDQFPGFYAKNLTLGQQDALWEHIWLIVIGRNAANWTMTLLGLGLGIVALALFSSQRRQLEYLWIFLQFFTSACILPLSIYESFHTVPANWDLLRQPLDIASGLFTILMYFAFLRLRFGWWIRSACAVAAAGIALSAFSTAHGSLPRLAGVVAQIPLVILLAGIVPVLLIVHFRRGNREAGILLIPVILQSLNYYAVVVVLSMLQVPALETEATRISAAIFNFQAGPFSLSSFLLSNTLYLLSLSIIMVLRSTRISRQQAVLENEVAAAREVQQVILPEQVESIPGFTVDSAYQPAQQVGGDFFQILPADEGGLLLVVGDVAGKGLPAAMLVSVLVGAIRGVAEYTSDPGELLANLNERLIGRTSGGFSTALVAHIAANGAVTIANAGHLSPYLDGREVELPGALPLGVAPGATYQAIRFHIPTGSRLTFYSDGVVEAQNLKGELLGFDRGRELSTQPAAAIVEAARQFGQSDDITVVVIQRDAAIANAA
jgi:hypothetical protein